MRGKKEWEALGFESRPLSIAEAPFDFSSKATEPSDQPVGECEWEKSETQKIVLLDSADPRYIYLYMIYLNKYIYI